MRTYFMGIGGTAMGHAALLAREAGHEVCGSDRQVYPPMSEVLGEAGIAFFEGYDERRLADLAPDLVVVGNALSRGNPEVEWLLDSRSVPFVSLPAFLHDHVLRYRRNLVIAGTHGKTSTTAMAAFLLRSSGRDPGFLIGGRPLDPPTGQHLGRRDEPFVIEGDEYDSAFFDKRSKFIHYAPQVAVLNNLEFDHADIFRDLADIRRSFSHFVRLVPRSGWIVLNGDDPNLAMLEPMPWTRMLRVGLGDTNDVRLSDFVETASGARFRLHWRGKPWGTVEWHAVGLHNARNAAMASVGAALILLPPGDSAATPPPIALSALREFRGVRRRQEVLLSSEALTVIEDFGHHPTAVGETLRAFRSRLPGHRIAVVFEPRSNTARTRALQADFIDAFALADRVYLGAVHRAGQLPEEDRFDRAAVVRQLTERGIVATAAPDNAALLGRLLEEIPSKAAIPQAVLFFSNGSFDGIISDFVRARHG